MKRWWVVLLLAGLLGAGLGVWKVARGRSGDLNCAVEKRIANSLQITPRYADLGAHMWGTQVPCEIVLSNNTDRATTILEIKSGCECTKALEEYEGVIVQSMESLTMSFAVSTGKWPGVKSSSIEVVLDDGKVLDHRMTMIVLSSYELSHNVVDFGELDVFSEVAVQQPVSFSAGPDVELLDVALAGDWVSMIQQKDEELVQFVISTIPGRVLPGEQRAALVITTTDPINATWSVPIHAHGVSLLRCYPPQVFLSASVPTQSVEVFDSENRPVRVTTISCESEGVSWELVAKNRVVISKRDAGAARGLIYLSLRDEADRRVVVPVHCL